MKHFLWIPLSILTGSLLLTGCGSTADPKAGTAALPAESSADESAGDQVSGDVEMKLSGQNGQNPDVGSGQTAPGSGSSKRIQSSKVSMELKVTPADTKDMIDKLKKYTAENGGYISSLETSLYELDEENAEEDSSDSKKAEEPDSAETGNTSANGDSSSGDDGGSDDYDSYYDNYYDSYYDDYYSYYNSHWTTMTIVLPSSKTDTLVKQLSSDYKVLDQSETITDYTARYRALLDKQAALEDEEKRLISLLEDARSSGQNRSSDSDSDFLEKVIQLENNLWQTRSDLNECRFGNMDNYSYYYGGGEGLYDFDEMNGMSTVELDIYVDPKK